jgi:SAM-dependent methyltransferase
MSASGEVYPINSRAYWEHRFGSGDWQAKGGRYQTRAFAQAIARRLDLPSGFDGVLLDFGCGLGDAIPVYSARFPRARLIGVDVSLSAVDSCRRDYGHIGTFLHGDHHIVPAVDAIVASNVLEHLIDQASVLTTLREKARHVFVAVPYRERIEPGGEHVNAYDSDSFAHLPVHCRHVYPCRGWSQYGRNLIWNVYAMNVARLLARRPMVARNKQILFHLRGREWPASGGSLLRDEL